MTEPARRRTPCFVVFTIAMYEILCYNDFIAQKHRRGKAFFAHKKAQNALLMRQEISYTEIIPDWKHAARKRRRN
jgi:hypothetical protein